MRKQTLLPCPFCGGKAEIYNISELGADEYYMVQCTKCPAGTCFGDASETQSGSIAAWNNRPEPKPSTGSEEAF